jgi:hypothetical protein
LLEVLETINKKFCNWKKQLNMLHCRESEFQKWLFINIASVLFGGKAGELLYLSTDQCGLEIEKQIKSLEFISLEWKFSYHIMNVDAHSAKIVIYKNDEVQNTLLRVPPCILEDRLNYSVGISPSDFLQQVKERWEYSQEIPHEIGLALGYPIKDVLGYMGLLPLECMGLCGWRIYGDPKPSLNQCMKYNKARQSALIFMAA